MSVGSYLVRVAGGAEKDIVAASKAVVGYVDGVIVDDILPPLENFFTVLVPAEIVTLKPYAIQALEELTVSLPALLAGGLPAFWAAVGPSLGMTASKALAAGIATEQVTQANVFAAVSSVVADAQVAATADAAANAKAA